MHLEVSFRNMRPRAEVRRRAESLFKKLHRFLDPAAEAQIVVNHEHGQNLVECVLTTHGTVHKQADEHEDLRTAVDRMFHGLEEQLRRAKEKRIDRHRAGTGEVPFGEVSQEPEDEDVFEDEEAL